jgi:hypothetical protein
MLYLYDIRSLIYRDLRQSSDNNDLLTTAKVDEAANLGLREFAVETKCFERTTDIAATSGTSLYSLPQDSLDMGLRFASFDGTRIRKSSIEAEDLRSITWRSLAAGTPTRFLWQDARQFRLVSTPNFTGSKTISAEIYCVPLSIGGGIATITRAANVVTLTTNRAHGLSIGDAVRIYGVTDTLTTHFDLNVATTLVVSVPTITSFTYTHTGDAGSGAAATGIVGYYGGVLPLYLVGDTPPIAAEYHDALVAHAVSTLAMGFLLNEQERGERIESALKVFEERVAKYKGEIA